MSDQIEMDADALHPSTYVREQYFLTYHEKYDI